MKQINFCLTHRESFVISLHVCTLLCQRSILLTRPHQLLKDGESPPLSDFMWVRRSTHYDLKDEAGRKEALSMLWALIRYIASGEAKVNIVRAAMKTLD